MKTKSKFLAGLLSALLIFLQATMAHALNVVKSAAITTVQGEVAGVEETLAVVIKNVSNNAVATGVTFPTGSAVASSPQYLEVSFQSNTLGAAVIFSTDNRRKSATGATLANPAFKSGPDGVLGPGTGGADDELFEPERAVSGAGLVGTDPKGHGFVVPLLWAIYDIARAGGYTFTGSLAIEGVVTDKAQTHTFQRNPDNSVVIVSQPFDSSRSLAYATVIAGMVPVNGSSKGQIASFPEDIDGPSNGNLNGLRPATSPICVYLGCDYSGAPRQGYATNTLSLELIHQ